MISELALWQEILLLGLAMISLLYVLYFRIWLAMATGSDLLFLAALALSVTSVVHPPVFAEASTRLVDRSALPRALAGADGHVAELEALPGRLIDRALAKIGYEREVEDEDLLPPEPGPFQTHVRPAFESLLALVLRTSSFMGAGFLLLMALTLRASTSTAREIQSLRRRLERLESEAQQRALPVAGEVEP